MTGKKKAEDSANGFKIFKKPGNAGERTAINFASGAVVETDGEGKFFAYIGGRQHAFLADATLEEVIAGDESDYATEALNNKT